MAFKQQVMINDQWVDLDDVKVRNVDSCDGCGEIMEPDGELDFAFRTMTYNRAEMGESRLARSTHRRKSCVAAAVVKTLDLMDGYEDLPE